MKYQRLTTAKMIDNLVVSFSLEAFLTQFVGVLPEPLHF